MPNPIRHCHRRHRTPHGFGSKRHSPRVVGAPSEYLIALPSHLEQHLQTLTDALEDPGTDLQAILAVLFDDLVDAVPSFLGLTMRISTGGQPSTISTLHTPGGSRAAPVVPAVISSLHLPLDAMGVADTGSFLRLYATGPGVFTDLATQTRATYGLDGNVVLDGHLHLQATDHAAVGPAQVSEIHQATGVLLAQGHPDPMTELDARATGLGLTRHQAAQRILRDPQAR